MKTELLKEIMSLPKGEADNATGSVPQKADEDKGEEGEQSIQEENRNLLAFLWVERVEAGSPAEAAGLRVGDRILQFGVSKVVNVKLFLKITTKHCRM